MTKVDFGFPTIIPVDISGVSEEERALYNAYHDLIVFGKLFDSGNFKKSATPDFHYTVCQKLNEQSTKPLAIIMPRGSAKHLKIDEPVLTKRGWIKVQDLIITDKIFGSDGKTKTIIGFSDIVEKDIYEVFTRDDRSLKVSNEHLWTVKNNSNNKEYTKTTKEILALKWKTKYFDKRYGKEYTNYKFSIPLPKPLEFPEKKLPIEPYVLGLLIGDGTLQSTPTLGMNDLEEVYKWCKVHNYSEIKRREGKVDYITFRGMQKDIRKLNLNVHSRDKFIPFKYKNASIKQRLSILQGLMDSDGTSSSGATSYATISKDLAEDVVYLVRSLGGIAKIKYTERKKYANYYNVSINLEMPLFRLKRKLDTVKTHYLNHVSITDIKYIGKDKCRCLSVDSHDELFIAKDFMLTHNTTIIKIKILRDLVFSQKAFDWGFASKPTPQFYGWVSDSQRKSQNNVGYLRHHLTKNVLIKRYFGWLPQKNRWNREDISLINGSRLVSKSNLSSLRGEVQTSNSEGEMRYTGVFCDDVESEANVMTSNAREKIRDTIMHGIYPAIDKHRGRLYFIGTPVHGDAFAQRILDGYNKAKEQGEIKNYTWDLLSYTSTQPEMEGGVLWHSFMPREKLDEIKQTYVDSPGGVGGYYQEYELQVQSNENSVWTYDHLRFWKGYYKREDEQNYIVMDGKQIPVNIFIGIDPATDIESRNSDFSVIMAIAVDSEKNCYVLEYEMHRSIPALGLKDSGGNILAGQKKGVADYIVDMVKKYTPTSITCEDVGMNRAVFQGYYSEQLRLGLHKFGMIPESPAGRNKLNRIYSVLNVCMTSKQMYIKDGMYDLQHQIVMFGDRLAHDDVIDSLSYSYCNAYPPNFILDENKRYVPRPKRVAKGWTYA